MKFEGRSWFAFVLGVTVGATLVVAGMTLPYLLV